jgi:predicted nucleic acid-binding protein
MSKIFVDSSLFVYTMDDSDPAKRDRCRALLASLRAAPHGAAADPHGVVSTQVLQETYAVATRKLGVDPLVVRGIIESVEVLEVVTVTPRLIQEAIDCSILNTISLWDALLVAAAASARCDTLWTEDLNPGQTILGVRIENPLQEDGPQIRID